jgi:hypothetical protein
MDIKRKDAARLLEDIALYVGQAKHAESDITNQANADALDAIEQALARYGLEPATRCTGEAHLPETAGNIDHCGVCMPDWGWCYAKVKVK